MFLRLAVFHKNHPILFFQNGFDDFVDCVFETFGITSSSSCSSKGLMSRFSKSPNLRLVAGSNQVLDPDAILAIFTPLFQPSPDFLVYPVVRKLAGGQ